MDRPGLDPLSLLRGVRRRIGMVLAIFVVGAILSAGVAYVLPPVYESTAKILVESQQIPVDLARSTVTASAAERLQLIEQRLMTRENLLDIAERLDLFADRPGLTPTEKVDRIRDATSFDSVPFNDNPRYRGPEVLSAFTITYASDKAAQAARVANEYVTMVLEQNLRTRNKRAAETKDFFSAEVKRLAGELGTLEAHIAAYKQEHEAALPESQEFRLNELSGLQERSFEREQRRLRLEEERRTLQDSLRARQNGTAPRAKLTPEEQDLSDLKRVLVQKRGLFSESHPEVRSLTARMAALESAIAATRMEPKAEDTEATNAAELELVQLRRQIALIDRQLDLIAEQQAAAERRRAALEASVAAAPKIEMALNAFNRRYEDLQTQYQIAVRKEAEAETGEKLEINKQAESFEVIEQAQVPEKPVAPKRALIAIGGSVASLAAALGLAVLLELMNASIRTTADLERLLQIHPIVSVPYIRTREEVRRRRLLWGLRLLTAAVLLSALLFAIDQFYLPLELIWQRAIDRIGLDEILATIARRFN